MDFESMFCVKPGSKLRLKGVRLRARQVGYGSESAIRQRPAYSRMASDCGLTLGHAVGLGGAKALPDIVKFGEVTPKHPYVFRN
jgi:hypothetical protein